MRGANGWVGRYVGIPFRDAGYDFSGCNCWGLVHLVLKHEAGVRVPTYAEVSATEIAAANDLFVTGAAHGPWIKVEKDLRPFDVALMRGTPMHAGVLVNETTILHVWKATQAVQMPLAHYRVRFRMLGFYRHKDLA